MHSASHQLSQHGAHVDASDALLSPRDFQTVQRCCKTNAKVLVSRFIQLVCRPTDFGPLILDICSPPLSFLRVSQSGTDFLYPLSSLAKRRSGRLGRLLLDHSKNSQRDSIHEAMVVERGFNPPGVVVIDLNEVPQDVIKRGYTAPADICGFAITTAILETLIAAYLYIFIPIKDGTKLWPIFWTHLWLGKRLLTVYVNWCLFINVALLSCIYAIYRGDGVLALIRRSGPIAPSCAVFLDREFTVILSGSQSIVEAIAESSFTISHSIPCQKDHNVITEFFQVICYEGFKALSSGVFLTLFIGIWLAFCPTSLFTVFMPLIPVMVISGVWSLAHAREIPEYQDLRLAYLGSVFLCVFMPSYILLLVYGRAIGQLDPLSEGILDFGLQYGLRLLLCYIPMILFAIFVVSSQDFPIRTTKFLDIIGNPPIRKWEFDTLAAAATFQCLVLCRNTTRPIKTIDMLALLDIFIPDQTEVWMAWKNRVADRITHEVDISFSPTLPMFGDERQQRLKELLDQAQIGYGIYRSFYDRHVPLYSTELSLRPDSNTIS